MFGYGDSRQHTRSSRSEAFLRKWESGERKVSRDGGGESWQEQSHDKQWTCYNGAALPSLHAAVSG